MLDGMIAMQEAQEARQRNREEGNLRPSEENQDYEENRNRMEQAMSDFLDSGDPQSIGYISEFVKLIEQRRAERGMPPSGSNR